jgi:thymidine phosphorylase
MDARAIIAKLRGGDRLSETELAWFSRGLADGAVSDAQAGAFAMAVCLNGLGDKGRAHLTLGMRDSGDVLRWDLNGPVVDKHSTGGLGDCVSLILAPALAACGAYVPMISGRGLGHTGGTLDKLEAIEGYETRQIEDVFRKVVGDIGCAIVSATGDMAPADRRLYAIRDVSATVESVDLITASILSKKLAAGLEALVLDVKCGSGAFMRSPNEARALARALVETANLAGCRTSALITDMDQPLAHALGNALEVREVLAVLCDNKQGRLLELTAELAGQALVAGGIDETVDQGAKRVRDVISSGHAAEVFARMSAAVGAKDPLNAAGLPNAPVQRPFLADRSGYLQSMDGVAIGFAVVEMGGGRKVETDRVDPSVGLSEFVSLGQKVEAGQPMCVIHAADEAAADRAEAVLRANIVIGDGGFETQPLVLEKVE